MRIDELYICIVNREKSSLLPDGFCFSKSTLQLRACPFRIYFTSPYLIFMALIKLFEVTNSTGYKMTFAIGNLSKNAPVTTLLLENQKKEEKPHLSLQLLQNQKEETKNGPFLQ